MKSAGGTASTLEVVNETAYLVSQQYDLYTRTEHEVWREVMAREVAELAENRARIHPTFALGCEALALPCNEIPRIEEINARLAPTGWSVACVAGYIPTHVYVGMMARRMFPVSRVIRRPEHIDYAPAPDYVHDVIGHLPMLFSSEHARYLRLLAETMYAAGTSRLDDELYEANRTLSRLRSSPTSTPADIERAQAEVARVHAALAANPSELTHLGRIYLWSVEFGLLGRPDDYMICGAALLSARRERLAVAAARRVDYSIDVIDEDIAFSDLQGHYYVAADYDHLLQVVREYRQRMSMRAQQAVC